MDPLSIAASIIGITTAAMQVSPLLKKFIDSASGAPTSARSILMEVSGIYICLQQLQGFLLGREQAARSRRSLIMIEQIVVVFTDCVSVFSELEQTLESLHTGEHMRVLDRLKWASKEHALSRVLQRLQSSKTSLNFMLNILTCTSMGWAEASTRELTSLVKEVLKTNVNMASRLRNLERMHPALVAPSRSVSQSDLALSEASGSRAVSRLTQHKFVFDEELADSPVYQKAAQSQVRFSKSSNSSYGPSSLSGLSLSDVTNVSEIALPISSKELWNHHRYGPSSIGSPAAISLDAWYNPPPKKSAFIRTAYYNGQYTNQYSQTKSIGHLVFRRFTIPAPDSPPIFTEGAIMPHSPRELERIGEESCGASGRFELEDTGCTIQGLASLQNSKPFVTHDAAPNSDGVYENMNPAPSTTHTADVEEPGMLASASLPGDSPPNAVAVVGHQPLCVIESANDTQTDYSPLPLSPPAKPLPRLPPAVFKRNSEVSALRRRRRRNSIRKSACSMFCEEEESILPTRKWSKPLSDMGDALTWKLGVLGTFNAIQY